MKWDSKNHYMKKISIHKSAEINIMYFLPRRKRMLFCNICFHFLNYRHKIFLIKLKCSLYPFIWEMGM